jgi:hypothetical protein
MIFRIQTALAGIHQKRELVPEFGSASPDACAILAYRKKVTFMPITLRTDVEQIAPVRSEPPIVLGTGFALKIYSSPRRAELVRSGCRVVHQRLRAV